MAVPIQTAAPAAAAPAAFTLPKGVEAGNDGKLVDNRAFYQTRATGNATLSTLQSQFDDAKANAPKEEKGFIGKTFDWIGGIFSTVYDAVVSAFKNIFTCFGIFNKAEANEEQKADNTAKKN